MRRKDREILDQKEIFDVLGRCHTIRLGIKADETPYVVPLSFGMEVIEDRAIVYFHCAKEGLKLDLLKKNPRVCLEADRFICVEKTEHGITTRYESVIGFGRFEIVTNQEEVIHGLQTMIEHYGIKDYPLERCGGLEHVVVGKIILDRISGKRNLPLR